MLVFIPCGLEYLNLTLLFGMRLSVVSVMFVCVVVLRPSQPNGVMSSAVSLSDHTFTRQT